MSQGAKFGPLQRKPLQIWNDQRLYSIDGGTGGLQAIYLSGGVTPSYGLPDLGMTSLNDVLEDVRRITSATEVPLLVDIDTGWGGAFNIARTIAK